ncbi:YisB protein [Xylariaceae sp. FL1651]|nr:YisB protein [Xylariaceae sp. FL1651]
MSIPEDELRNYELFRDSLTTALIEKISEPQVKPRRRTKTRAKKAIVSPPSHVEKAPNGKNTDLLTKSAKTETSPNENDIDEDAVPGDDLADFADYIAAETFACLPSELKTVDYHEYTAIPSLQTRYALPLTGADVAIHLPLLDPSIGDSLTAYGITHEHTQGINEFLAPVLTAYLTALGTAPPPPSSTRTDACEICGRDWINLSYHHLIPRFVHAKAVKRGWHRECDLQNVAWLCGACHRFVHRFAGHEDLARKYYTVELLMAEDEVRRWAQWVGRLRWKGK